MTSDDPTGTAATGTAGGGADRRLRRSDRSRMVAGVAGGLGEYAAVDPVIFRVLFAVLTVVGGAGALLYLLCWVLLPDARGRPAPAETLLGRQGSRPRTGEVILIAVTTVALAAVVLRAGTPDLVLLATVAVAAVLAYQHLGDRFPGRRPPDTPPAAPTPGQPSGPPPQPPPPPPAATPTADTPGAAPTAGPSSAGPFTASFTAPPDTTARITPPEADPFLLDPPPARHRPRPRLAAVTVCALLVLAGGAVAVDVFTGADPTIHVTLAVALALVGAALVAGAWLDGARPLIALGIPLSAVLILAGDAADRLRDGVGDRGHRPAAASDVREEYRLGVGSVRLDLRGVDFTERPVATRVRAGVGLILVRVPETVDVVVHGEVDVGQMSLLGSGHGALGDARSVTSAGPDGTGGGRLTLDLDMGVGEVVVTRGTS